MEGLATSLFARLLAFVPEYFRADGIFSETIPAEEGSQDVRGGWGDSENEQYTEEDLEMEDGSGCTRLTS